MSRKGMFEGLTDRARRPVSAEPAPVAKRFGAAMTQMRDRLDRADEIEQALASGDRVVEVETGLIDPSPIRDRLRGSSKVDEEFRRTLAEHGQQVPVLLRPHPMATGRYLTVYGHRRVAALHALGRRVRAVVVDLSDNDAFVAQGVENNARRDLSYIERALFAQRLSEAGASQAHIAAALHTAQPNVSAMIAVVRKLPIDLVEAIGASPSIGGPKWSRLTKIADGRDRLWKAAIATQDFYELDGDERFARVTAALEPSQTKSPSIRRALKDRQGAAYASIERTATGARLTMQADKDVSFRSDRAAFADWLIERLDDLRDAWRRDE